MIQNGLKYFGDIMFQMQNTVYYNSVHIVGYYGVLITHGVNTTINSRKKFVELAGIRTFRTKHAFCLTVCQ